MSNALAIATVTAALRERIEDQIDVGLPGGIPTDWGLAGTRVTMQPPDRARTDDDGGNQLNLFLYQVAPSAAWRNTDIASQVKPGERSTPPLGLDLFYLLTAYGQKNDDFVGHVLLGQAMRALNDRPLLMRDELAAALQIADLHQQVERVRITLHPMSNDEMSKLWTTFQSQYRVSVAYQVSVVLIESLNQARAALPVLRRGSEDRGPVAQGSLIPPYPTLEAVRTTQRDLLAKTQGPGPGPPRVVLPSQPADPVAELSFTGHHLDRPNPVLLFRRTRDPQPFQIRPEPSPTSGEVRVIMNPGLPAPALTPPLPPLPSVWAAGHYLVSVGFRSSALNDAYVPAPTGRSPDPVLLSTTNELTVALAPRIVGIAPAVGADNVLSITVQCEPPIHPDQRVSVLLGDREYPAVPLADLRTVTSRILPAISGDHYVRLRVDGVDSPLVVEKPDPTDPLPDNDPNKRKILAFDDDNLKVTVP